MCLEKAFYFSSQIFYSFFTVYIGANTLDRRRFNICSLQQVNPCHTTWLNASAFDDRNLTVFDGKPKLYNQAFSQSFNQLIQILYINVQPSNYQYSFQQTYSILRFQYWISFSFVCHNRWARISRSLRLFGLHGIIVYRHASVVWHRNHNRCLLFESVNKKTLCRFDFLCFFFVSSPPSIFGKHNGKCRISFPHWRATK